MAGQRADRDAGFFQRLPQLLQLFRIVQKALRIHVRFSGISAAAGLNVLYAKLFKYLQRLFQRSVLKDIGHNSDLHLYTSTHLPVFALS